MLVNILKLVWVYDDKFVRYGYKNKTGFVKLTSCGYSFLW